VRPIGSHAGHRISPGAIMRCALFLCLLPIATLAAAEDELPRIEFRQLSVLDNSKAPSEQNLPKDIARVVGKRVQIIGFMSPPFVEQPRDFAVVSYASEVRFVQYKSNELFRVRAKKAVPWSTRPLKVEGVFGIEAVAIDGEKMLVYRLEEATASRWNQ
jgi:hypothetical protein